MNGFLSRYRVIVIAILSATFLVGCASTGGLHSTAQPLQPADLHARETLHNVKQTAAAWPDQHWWKAADDAQLDKLVAQAVADNPTMTLVGARVRAAFAAAGAVDVARKPTLSAAAKVAGTRLPPLLPPIASGHYGTIRLGYLSFSWDLDIWGGKRAAWQAAVGKARAAQVDAEAARLKLSADVVQAYFDLAGTYTLQHLANEELQRARHFFKLTRKRVRQGINARFSLIRIQGETAADRMRVKAANNAVKKAGLVLASLLGQGPDFAQSIQKPDLPKVPALVLPGDLSVNLISRRPDVIAARWRVQAASQNIAAAKTAFLPNLSISALAGLIAPSGINLFDWSSRFYSVSPALAIPIFEGGKLRANLVGKDAAYGIAVAKYNQTLIHAINQIAAQVDDMRSLNAQVKYAEAARDSARQAYQLSLKRFHAGVGNYLESLEVRQQLIAAERKLAKIELQRCKTWATLNMALGGGFKPANDAPQLAVNRHATTKESQAEK